ncbi:hypothetical protein ECG_04538 [Echinococcus granulosus]|uniref:Dynein light chain n=2 Tax=Echinococcus TaxID=6209 RepID=A0A068WAR7_ECHGR|nr:hypothetical protein ECG_04538 [Echinococcus granulosus]CDS17173.1 dynein light chain [Echinococcus granulosus]CDS42201.1 dynein light chain [Echinococcus multilocularis]
MEGTPKVFLVERADFRNPNRSEIIGKIREITIKSQKEPKEMASRLKDMLDEDIGRHWHVVVGTDYAAFMSYCPGGYIQARYGDLTILMYRLG